MIAIKDIEDTLDEALEKMREVNRIHSIQDNRAVEEAYEESISGFDDWIANGRYQDGYTP